MLCKRAILGFALQLHLLVSSISIAEAANQGVAELDALDRQEFNTHLERASSCMKTGDFDCASKELGIARKFANGTPDNRTLASTAQTIELERQRRLFAEAQGKYNAERATVNERAADAEREAAESNRAADRMAAYDNAERRSRELASRSDSSTVTPTDIINRQIQKNAAEAQAMIHQVNRQTAQANAQIARASEQKRTQDRSGNTSSSRSRTNSNGSTQTTATQSSQKTNVDAGDMQLASNTFASNAQNTSSHASTSSNAKGAYVSAAEQIWQRDVKGPKKQVDKWEPGENLQSEAEARRSAETHFVSVKKSLDSNFANHTFYERLVKVAETKCGPFLIGPDGKPIQWICKVHYVVEVPDTTGPGGTLSK